MRRIVWGRATSSNVMKVLWGLGELGLPFERIDVGGPFGKTDTTEYRAMNPTGLVLKQAKDRNRTLEQLLTLLNVTVPEFVAVVRG